MPMPGGEWPGTGAILAAVETASGRVAEIGGKPERHLFEIALAALSRSIHDDVQRNRGARVAMVGDRLSSDIEGGRAGGAGDDPRPQRHQRPRARPRRRTPPPDHVVDDLAAPAAVSAEPAAPAHARPGAAFAGIFAVTFCGLLAVGAVLPVLPRYVARPARRRRHRGRDRDRRLRDHRPAAAPLRRPLRRPPRTQADGPDRLAC